MCPVIPEMLNITGYSIKYPNSCVIDSLLKSRKIFSMDVKCVFVSSAQSMYIQTCVKIILIITTNFRDNVYGHGTGKMSGISNDPLQGLLASTPDIILIFLFSNLKTLHALV
jgi:hypothetical protein